MGRVKKQAKRKKYETKDIKRPPTSSLSLEERLQVIANLIVDRIIEDQQNGTLRFKTREASNHG